MYKVKINAQPFGVKALDVPPAQLYGEILKECKIIRDEALEAKTVAKEMVESVNVNTERVSELEQIVANHSVDIAEMQMFTLRVNSDKSLTLLVKGVEEL